MALVTVSDRHSHWSIHQVYHALSAYCRSTDSQPMGDGLPMRNLEMTCRYCGSDLVRIEEHLLCSSCHATLIRKANGASNMRLRRKTHYRTNVEIRERRSDSAEFLYALDLYLKKRLTDEGGDKE